MKRNRLFSVVDIAPVGATHFLLEIHLPEPLPEIAPGQFCEVLVEHSPQTFLRRPFSIHNADYTKNNLVLFIKIAGAGTLQLSKLSKDDSLSVLFPLGKGFTIADGGKALLAGGGCGIAPLLFLARRLKEQKVELDILAAGKSISDIPSTEEFSRYGNLLIMTEDGSAGEQGLLTHHSVLKPGNNYDMVYCCGPEPMMKSVARWSFSHNADCEVSLEHKMACGFGACLCCVTPSVSGHVCVCTEGPVFNTKQLSWQT